MQILTVSKEFYSKEPLLKTAYSFTDRVYIHLSQDEQNWIINWESKDGSLLAPQEFENELIQQQTRLLLEQKTADVRKMIIARALASTIIDRLDVNESEQLPGESSEAQATEDILKGWHEIHDHV